jgi:hypothetical protein
VVNKFKTTVLVLDKKIKRRRHVLTEEELDDTGSRLKRSPRKSLAKLAEEADVSVTSAGTGTKLPELRPDKITQVHSLQPRYNDTFFKLVYPVSE